MELLQNMHFEERGLNYIGYNFVVGGDGRVYEGRGWLHQGDQLLDDRPHMLCLQRREETKKDHAKHLRR